MAEAQAGSCPLQGCLEAHRQQREGPSVSLLHVAATASYRGHGPINYSGPDR